MKRRLLALALLLPALARAQPAREDGRGLPELDDGCEQAELFGGTRIERAAFCAMIEEAFVSARSLARRALDEDRTSYRAHYLLGVVQHRAESNLPKSLHHLERARAGFDAEHGAVLGETDPARFLAYRILFELMDVHGEMDHHEERIAFSELITTRIGVEHRASAAWPLMKLGRFEEARQVVEEALASEDGWSRAVARTSRCAIESELRNREEAYEACKAAAEPVRSKGRGGGAVELTNAGAAAEELLRFDEAERLYLEAARRNPETSVNPWGRLVHLYLSQGRFAEALGGWRQMRAYRARRSQTHFDQQDWAESQMAGASVLLVGGKVAEAAAVLRRVVARPDRQGTSSASSDQNEAGGALMARTVFLEAARQLEEQAAIGPFFAGLGLRLEAAQLRLEGWREGRRASRILANPERLVTTLRPEVPGSLELPGWLDAEVIGLVGPGVARAALDVAEAEETLPPEESFPVFGAYRAEAAWLAGDLETAARLGAEVVQRAGRGFTLVAARAAAVAADAETRLRRTDAALARFREALEREPGVIRRLGLRLPVRLSGVGAVGEAAAERLAWSSGLRVVPWGFLLEVRDNGARLRAFDGSELVAVPVAPPPPDEADPARYLARAVQRGLLVPLIDITQADVRSLEGGVGRGARADEQLDRIGAEP